MKQPIKLYLRDEKQYIMIYKVKGGYQLAYYDMSKLDAYTLANIVGGKIIV
jgi:hypothetical protein